MFCKLCSFVYKMSIIVKQNMFIFSLKTLFEITYCIPRGRRNIPSLGSQEVGPLAWERVRHASLESPSCDLRGHFLGHRNVCRPLYYELDLDSGPAILRVFYYIFFYNTLLSQWEFISHGKFGSLSPGKPSCNRVPLSFFLSFCVAP